MSLKSLLGLEDSGLSNDAIMAKLWEADAKNLDHIEFVIGGEITKVSMPHINFDPNSDKDSW